MDQREEGIQRLSGHFSWSELSANAAHVRAHQQFVYETAMFATARGIPWPDVTSATRMAKRLFPELKGLDSSRVVSLLRDRMSECMPFLSPLHHSTLLLFLSEACVARQRLIQAVVGGAGNLSVMQAQLEVQVPPKPLPLSQGADVDAWELQGAHGRLDAIRSRRGEELQHLREGSEVTLGELDIPQEGTLDKDAVLELVRGAVSSLGELLLDRLQRESSLVYNLLELKLQHTALATGGLYNTGLTSSCAGVMEDPTKHTLDRRGASPTHTARTKRK